MDGGDGCRAAGGGGELAGGETDDGAGAMAGAISGVSTEGVELMCVLWLLPRSGARDGKMARWPFSVTGELQ